MSVKWSEDAMAITFLSLIVRITSIFVCGGGVELFPVKTLANDLPSAGMSTYLAEGMSYVCAWISSRTWSRLLS